MYIKNQHVSKHLCNDLPISRGKKTQQEDQTDRQTDVYGLEASFHLELYLRKLFFFTDILFLQRN